MKQDRPHLTGMREMPSEERPRERLTRLGAEALRDAELIAILLRTGTRTMGVLALAEQVLTHFGSLRALSHASLEELMEVSGLGQVKAVELKAALDLGKRLASRRDDARRKVETAKDVADILMAIFRDLQDEHFKCLLLNTKNELLRTVDVSKGGLDAVAAVPRDVFRHAVKAGASAIIVCHNHPSGDPEPSRDDIALTKRLRESADILGIRFLDHVIFGDGRHVSLQERGLV